MNSTGQYLQTCKSRPVKLSYHWQLVIRMSVLLLPAGTRPSMTSTTSTWRLARRSGATRLTISTDRKLSLPDKVRMILGTAILKLFCSTSVPLASARLVRFKPLSTLIWAMLSINTSNAEKFQRKFFGNTGNQSRGCWVRGRNATSMLCSPQKLCL